MVCIHHKWKCGPRQEVRTVLSPKTGRTKCSHFENNDNTAERGEEGIKERSSRDHKAKPSSTLLQLSKV